MPTDRGYVIIRDQGERGYRIEVCSGFDERRGPFNPIAIHSGAEGYVVIASRPLEVRGTSQYSREPLEVFVPEDDGRVHIADVMPSPLE